MKRSRFNDERIIGILKEQEAGLGSANLCRKHGISSATFYKWKAKYGGPGTTAILPCSLPPIVASAERTNALGPVYHAARMRGVCPAECGAKQLLVEAARSDVGQ